MNLFPAGFNNLNPAFLSVAAEAAHAALSSVLSGKEKQKIVIIPENHTRNLAYWQNISALLQILQKTGHEVKVGSLLPDYPEPFAMMLADGVSSVQLQSVVRHGDRLQVGDFVPDAIILNNDLSDGIPDSLRNLSQPLIPPAELGWSQRQKSDHFRYYAEVTAEFAVLAEMDSWLFSPLFRHCGEVDFMQRAGEACLQKNSQALFAQIREKYARYKITCDPFIVMKADAGTYGMAVMTVRSPEELISLNRKERTRMAKTKSGQPVRRVILQEGVYTFETVGPENAVAEPVVYLCGERVIGGFYRVHKGRGRDENLNAPGMQFEPLPFVKPCHTAVVGSMPGDCQNRFYVYGVVARLSMLAAAREIFYQKK